MFRVLILCGVILLSACSNQKLRWHEADVEQFIVTQELQSIQRIQQFKFWGWQPVADRYLILTSNQQRHHLIKLMSPCLELRHTNEIGLKQQFETILNAKFDAILVPGQFPQRCAIDTIYPLSKAQKDQLKDQNAVRGQVQVGTETS